MRGKLFPDVVAGGDVGGFTVEGLLGMGACGVVYLATRGQERFALKLQSLALLAGWPEREAALLMRLRHPNVVGFRGCGLYPDEAPAWFFLAMEYVEGRTLHRWVEEENPGARRAAELLRGMARGLAALHAAGALHRDVKEENVMVREADGEPVLVDLGVGDYVGAPRLTQGVLPPGTPRYRSPEALAFRRDSRQPGARYQATPADDVYALGVVFYWVLCAHHPFHGVDTPTEVDAVIRQEPMAPHALNARVPPALGELCMRMLSKRPGERMSAEGVREAVEALLAGADASWEVALCEAWEDAPTVPRPPPASEAEALERWLEDGEGEGGPPRRGRRRARQAAAVAEAHVPAQLQAEAPVPAARVSAPAPAPEEASVRRGHRPVPASAPEEVSVPAPARHRARVGGEWVVALLAVVVAGAAWVLARTERPLAAGPAARTWAPGREVAPEDPPLESVRAAPLLPAVPTRAAAVPEAAPAPKEEASVKKSPDAAVAPPPTATRLLKSAVKTVAAAAACTGLACSSGPQPRPPPPGAPCPEGAVEAMSKLGIRLGLQTEVAFDQTAKVGAYVPVREGGVRLQLGPEFGKLDNGTAAGELVVGKRVYVRLTEAWPRGSSESFPVCLELRTRPAVDGALLGAPREPGDTGSTTARALNLNRVVAVDRFH